MERPTHHVELRNQLRVLYFSLFEGAEFHEDSTERKLKTTQGGIRINEFRRLVRDYGVDNAWDAVAFKLDEIIDRTVKEMPVLDSAPFGVMWSVVDLAYNTGEDAVFGFNDKGKRNSPNIFRILDRMQAVNGSDAVLTVHDFEAFQLEMLNSVKIDGHNSHALAKRRAYNYNLSHPHTSISATKTKNGDALFINENPDGSERVIYGVPNRATTPKADASIVVPTDPVPTQEDALINLDNDPASVAFLKRVADEEFPPAEFLPTPPKPQVGLTDGG